MRECKDCHESKPMTEFYLNDKIAMRYKYICKVCDKRRNAVWRGKNPSKIRASWNKASQAYQSSPEVLYKRRLRRHSITDEEFQTAFQKQNGLCAICNRELSLQIDHRHLSQEFRGLLCRDCNLGLGNFGDSIDRLRAAVIYLQSADGETVSR